MNKNTTIKVSKKTLERLHKLAGELASKSGKRISLEEAIKRLLEEREHHKIEKSSKKENDIKIFLDFLNQKVTGAGPEDFKEYDYDDI
ncbi:MAG: hypothetical protein ACTSRH_12825 [Promethearchaeota archaeon]